MRRQRAAALLIVLTVAACGSTVQVRGSGASPAGGLDGTSAGTSTAVDGGALPTSSVGTTGATTGRDPGASTGSSGSTGAVTGGGSSLSPMGNASGARGAGSVEVGFLVLQDVGKTLKTLGYSNLSTGDGKRQATVSAGLMNASGGLAGHRVVPVIFEVSASGDSNQMQAACSLFFEDHKVRAVIAVIVDQVVLACAKQHAVPIVISSNGSLDSRALASNGHLAIPNMPPIENGSAQLVDGLVAQGWFRPAQATEQVKIGLITHQNGEYAPVQGVVAARLKAAGLTLADTYFMPDGKQAADVAAASSAGKSAALKFRSEGINRVVVVDNHGFGADWFGVGANSQGYYPRLGVSSFSQPSTLPAILTAQQLAGSAGIGWAPVLDTDVSLQAPVSRRTTICLNAMRRAGEDTSAAERPLAQGMCDGAYTLLDAWRSGELDLSGFLSGLQALGSSYQAVEAFGTDFTRSRAAASRFKALRYDSGCNCFRYSGALEAFR